MKRDSSWRDAVSLRGRVPDGGFIEVSHYTDIAARTTAFCNGPHDGSAVLCTSLGGTKKATVHVVNMGKGGGKTAPLTEPAACATCRGGFLATGSCASPTVTIMTLAHMTPSEVDLSEGGHTDPIASVDANTEAVVAVGVGATTVFVDGGEGEVVLTVPGTSKVKCVRWWGQGCCATLDTTGSVHLVDPRTPKPPAPISTSMSMTRLCGSLLVPYALWVAGDSILSLYDMRMPSPRPVVTTPTLQSGLIDICASAVRAHFVATAATDGTVKLWVAERRVPVVSTTPHDTCFPIGMSLTTRSACEAIVTAGALGDCVVQRLTPNFFIPLAYHGCADSMPLAREVEDAMYCGAVAEAHEYLPMAVGESRKVGCAEDGLRLLALCTKRLVCPPHYSAVALPLLDVLKEMTYFSLQDPPLDDVAPLEDRTKEVVDRLTMNMLLALYIQNHNLPAVRESVETLLVSIKSGVEADIDTGVISDCVAFLMRHDHTHGILTAEKILAAIFDGPDVGPHSVPLLHAVVMTSLSPLALDDVTDANSTMLRILYVDPSSLSNALKLVRTVVGIASSKRDAASVIIATIAEYEAGVETEGNISVLAIPSLPVIMLYLNSLLHVKDIPSFLWIASAYSDRYANNKNAAVIGESLSERLASLQTSVTDTSGAVKAMCVRPLANASQVDEVMVLLGRVHTLQMVFLRCLRCYSEYKLLRPFLVFTIIWAALDCELMTLCMMKSSTSVSRCTRNPQP